MLHKFPIDSLWEICSCGLGKAYQIAYICRSVLARINTWLDNICQFKTVFSNSKMFLSHFIYGADIYSKR